ncbi:hypothetical protein [Elongatibacter sediminis]|uniref:Uncharacterized protein n=1 Tax=Elongatibacter sediminis TaxID=3119006 RepID=A0AAW9RDP9_9GAMM
MKPIQLIQPFAISALLALGTAYAGPSDEASTEVADAVEAVESAPVDAAAVDAASPSEQAVSRFSEGMQIPVDGSSLEAFEKSLEAIGEQATKAEFTTLNNAIDYLMIYDLAAKRNREKLASNLDGLTGEQIVDKVQWRKGKKY